MPEEKTDEDWFAVVRAGGRVCNKLSLHAEEDPSKCHGVHCWRTIVCDGETDVIECSRCGKQALSKCDFDEEFA